MSASGLTPRTMKMLRDLGYEVQKVEHYHFYSKMTTDLFGVIDLIAMKPGILIGVQSTSYNQRTPHIQKILAEPRALTWVQTGCWLWMVSWKKEKMKRGGVAFRYVPVLDVFTEKDFQNDNC